MSRVTARTRVVALLGHPVAHSQSPTLHNGWIEQLGLDAVYVAMDGGPACPTDPALLVRAGLWGANLTIPLKTRATPDQLEADAAATGAVNTLYWRDGLLVGANTDVEGFRHSTEAALGSLAGRRCLVLGTGGAARAVIHALQSAQADRVEVAGRTDRGLGLPVHLLSEVDTRGFDLVVQTLPAAGRAAVAALDLPQGAGAAWVDLNYWDADPPLASQARAAGIPFVTGHAMLDAQARAAFERWFGVRPPEGS